MNPPAFTPADAGLSQLWQFEIPRMHRPLRHRLFSMAMACTHRITPAPRPPIEVGEMVGTLYAKQYDSVRLASRVESLETFDPTASVGFHVIQYEILRSGC